MIRVDPLVGEPLEKQPLELVERKGRGHPDTITDSVVDMVSVALNKEFIRRWNTILHYNLDKGLLVAGRSRPVFGGGSVERPMLLVLGDRATVEVDGDAIDLKSLVDRVARDWVKNNLRYVDSDKHLRIQNEIGKSAGNLADIFGRGGESLGANDTSAAVGYAPETRTEILVRKVEKHVNSPAFQHRFPEVGEDVKVMGMRTKTDLDLTISIAFVDRFIGTESEYFRKKEEVRLAVESFAREESGSDSVAVTLNNLDRPGRGIDGIYLTVTGTSAESGDSGQVGRGNRVNGLFSLCRPPSSEATSGKNPVSHVGKIYNNMAFKVARNIVGEVDDVLEAHFWLLSKIGEPVDSPRLAAAQVILAYGANQEKTLRRAREVIEESLTTTAFRELIGMLIDGKNPLESNPLSSEK